MHYKCPKCNYETDCKPSFKRHIFRKRPCSSNSDASLENLRKEIVPEKSNHVCKFCKKGFNSISGYAYHVARAHISIPEDDKTKAELRSFGLENTQYLTDDFLRKMSYHTTTGIPEIARQIHFNPEHPENHNVRVVTKRDRLVERFVGGKWVMSPHYEVVNMMYWSVVRILQSFMADPDFISTHDTLIDTIVEEYNKLLGSSQANTQVKNAIFVMMTDETKKIHGSAA